MQAMGRTLFCFLLRMLGFLREGMVVLLHYCIDASDGTEPFFSCSVMNSCELSVDECLHQDIESFEDSKLGLNSFKR